MKPSKYRIHRYQIKGVVSTYSCSRGPSTTGQPQKTARERWNPHQHQPIYGKTASLSPAKVPSGSTSKGNWTDTAHMRSPGSSSGQRKIFSYPLRFLLNHLNSWSPSNAEHIESDYLVNDTLSVHVSRHTLKGKQPKAQAASSSIHQWSLCEQAWPANLDYPQKPNNWLLGYEVTCRIWTR